MRQEEMYNEMNEQQWIARQEEMLSGEHQLLGSKKEIIEKAREWALEVSDRERGSEEIHKRYASIQRIKEYIDNVQKVFKNAMSEGMADKELECHGMKFSKLEDRKVLDYSVDEVWNDLKQQLKEREELLKTAKKSKSTIYDDGGVEVTKCPYKPSSPYIKVSY